MVAGRIIVGPYVKLACKRHLDDLEHAKERGLFWDLVDAQLALDYFHDCLTVEIDGETRPFELLPWEQFVIGSIYGWKRRATRMRRFDRAYIEGAKGSGKTPLLAGIGLKMLTSDHELSAEVYSAGAKRDQAMILFSDAVKMVDASPLLRRPTMIRQSGKNPVWQLYHPKSQSKFKPLSADKTKSGQRVSCGLVDELHEHKDRYTIDMLKSGFKNRKQPLLAVATNSGFDRNSICYEWHEHTCAVLEGLREDDSLFGYVMALDLDDDPLQDESCWIKTNPGLGVTVSLEYLRGQVNDARQIPGREPGVRRLNFCQWVDSDLGWITRSAWVACEEELATFEKGAGRPIDFEERPECFIGLDLSFAFDLTAIAFALPEGDKLLTWIEYFTPLDTAAEREKIDRVPYRLWIDQGLIHAVPGKVIRMKHVGARIAEVLDRFDLQWAAYDRYRHKDLVDAMAEEGIEAPWIEHPQGFRRAGQLDIKGPDGKPLDNPLWMPDSVQKLETRILDKTLRVQPSPVTRWQVSSVVIRQDPAGTGNRVFDKRKAVGRIDGLVALAMAIGAADMRLPKMDLSAFLNRPVMTR